MNSPHHSTKPIRSPLEPICVLRQGGRHAEALREAVAVLRSTEPGSYPTIRRVWQEFFLGKENLAWEYARSLCQPFVNRPDREACLRDVQGLDHTEVLNMASGLGHYQQDWPLLGLIDTVRAAVTQGLGDPE